MRGRIYALQRPQTQASDAIGNVYAGEESWRVNKSGTDRAFVLQMRAS
jgi:hypothetical protein